MRVQARDGGYDHAWTMADMQRYTVGTSATEAPAWASDNLNFWLQNQDPLASFHQAEARIDLNYRFLHPVVD